MKEMTKIKENIRKYNELMNKEIGMRINPGKRIAIGIYRERTGYDKKIIKAVRMCDFAEIVVVDEGERTEERLIELAESGEVDAIVRGTARASKFVKKLKERYRFYRIALLETAYNKLFFLAPVGVDEGNSVAERVEIALKAKEVARKLGFDDSIAVIAGGRIGDLGRNEKVDRSIAEAELIAKIVDGVNREILIEDVKEGIIIAPDGIVGNLIFRTLCYLGNGREYGAIYVGLPFIAIDTSRAQTPEGYLRALAFASIV